MTKEELKQEAEVYYEDETEGTFQICEDCYWFADAVQTAYVDSAEPREKRIAELEARCNELFLQTCEQAKKIAELEAQNEKMKCCANCKHSRTEYEHCRTNKHEKWEIKENG